MTKIENNRYKNDAGTGTVEGTSTSWCSLVPRVSLLPAKSIIIFWREEKRSWERGCGWWWNPVSKTGLRPSRVLVPKLLSNMTYPHCAMRAWKHVSTRAVSWLDNKNRKLFECFNEDLPKTAFFPPTEHKWTHLWRMNGSTGMFCILTCSSMLLIQVSSVPALQANKACTVSV